MPEPASAHEPYYSPAKVPPGSLGRLSNAASSCRACHLWMCGSRTVFGEGPASARLVLIGEMPGDREDLAGIPFVGPAGALLDDALEEAGIDRSEVYVTNAVKHFKWEAGAKGRRLHAKPNRKEMLACRPWLIAELKHIEPEAIVCLGATAAQALFGAAFRLTQHRGEILSSEFSERTLATPHPAAILRAISAEERRKGRAGLVSDLRQIALHLASPQRRARLI